MLNLKFAENLTATSPSEDFHKYFKDYAGERHFATFWGKSELAFIQLGVQFDCILEWTHAWRDSINCYLIHFFSDQEAFVIDYWEDVDITETPHKIVDCELEMCGFISLQQKMENIKLSDQDFIDLIVSLGPTVLGKISFKRLSELHATHQFNEQSFKFNLYEAMRELGCRSTQVVNRSAIRHGKILKKLKEMVPNYR